MKLKLRRFALATLLITATTCTTYEYKGKEFASQAEMDQYKDAEKKKQEEQNRKTALLKLVRRSSEFQKCECKTRKLGSFLYGATCSTSLKNRGEGELKAPTVTFNYIVRMFGNTSAAYTQAVPFPETTIKADATVSLSKDIEDDGMLQQALSALELNRLTPLGSGIGDGQWKCSITDVQM